MKLLSTGLRYEISLSEVCIKAVHTSATKPTEQYLWPTILPLNNRFIDVPSYLWNPDDTSSEK
jgi:hypothetical protein